MLRHHSDGASRCADQPGVVGISSEPVEGRHRHGIRDRSRGWQIQRLHLPGSPRERVRALTAIAGNAPVVSRAHSWERRRAAAAAPTALHTVGPDGETGTSRRGRVCALQRNRALTGIEVSAQPLESRPNVGQLRERRDRGARTRIEVRSGPTPVRAKEAIAAIVRNRNRFHRHGPQPVLEILDRGKTAVGRCRGARAGSRSTRTPALQGPKSVRRRGCARRVAVRQARAPCSASGARSRPQGLRRSCHSRTATTSPLRGRQRRVAPDAGRSLSSMARRQPRTDRGARTSLRHRR